MKSFALRHRQLRENRGLSQKELADLLDINVMQISKYERGLTLPALHTAVEIARILQVGLDELVLGDTADSRPPEIRDVRLLERFRDLDEAPKETREVALEVLDAIVTKQRLAALSAPARQRKTA